MESRRNGPQLSSRHDDDDDDDTVQRDAMQKLHCVSAASVLVSALVLADLNFKVCVQNGATCT